MEETVLMVYQVFLVKWDKVETKEKRDKRDLLDSLDLMAHRVNQAVMDHLVDLDKRVNPVKSKWFQSKEKLVIKDLPALLVCLVSMDNKEGTESLVKMAPKANEVSWELLVMMVSQVFKVNLVREVTLVVMVRTVLVSQENKENVVNLVMLVKLVSQEDKVKRENLQRKCLSLDKRESAVFQEWSDYLAVQEHLVKKAKLDHLVSMVSTGLKVKQDNVVYLEEVFKDQLEKREKLDLLVKLDYPDVVEMPVKTAYLVSMACQANLENKVLDIQDVLVDQEQLELKVKLVSKETKVLPAPMVYVEHPAHKEKQDETAEEEDLVSMEILVKRVNPAVQWLVLRVKTDLLEKLVKEVNLANKVPKVKEVYQEMIELDKRVNQVSLVEMVKMVHLVVVVKLVSQV